MEKINRKNHWDNIYQSKTIQEVSWYQPKPETSLQFIRELKLPLTAKIIDIGGGDSFLVDCLLDLGYENITVLDISATAIERAKQRLGNHAQKVKWIITDVTNFQPKEKYDVWHDRAAFHFLTAEKDITNYLHTAYAGLATTGVCIIGAFSLEGPKKCSGIEVRQYSDNSMIEKTKDLFENMKCMEVAHTTPFETVQQFIFCSFRKRQQESVNLK